MNYAKNYYYYQHQHHHHHYYRSYYAIQHGMRWLNEVMTTDNREQKQKQKKKVMPHTPYLSHKRSKTT